MYMSEDLIKESS